MIENDIAPNQIDAERWPTMTFDELMSQKAILIRRYDIAITTKKPLLAKAMIEGLSKLDTLIQSKT